MLMYVDVFLLFPSYYNTLSPSFAKRAGHAVVTRIARRGISSIGSSVTPFWPTELDASVSVAWTAGWLNWVWVNTYRYNF